MPRKALIADVQAASERDFSGISDVARGPDDESVYATYTPNSGIPIDIELLVQPDLGSYPAESYYMIFSRSTVVPDGVGDILQGAADFSAGMRVPDILSSLSQKLERHFTRSGPTNGAYYADSDVDTMDLDSAGSGEDGSEEEYFADSDQDDFNMGLDNGSEMTSNATFKLTPETAAKLNHRIREDLRAVRLAGFKIGILIGMRAESVHSLLSLSIQVNKIGLSEEALQAWDLEPQQYIIFLIRFSNGYKSFDAIIGDGVNSLDISFRAGVGNRYKPTIAEAMAAFSDSHKESGKTQNLTATDAVGVDQSSVGFSTMFISSSLHELLNKRFISLLKIRNSVGVGWDGAKTYFNDKEGLMEHAAELNSQYYEESSPHNSALPDLVTADHLTDDKVIRISFPLIALQFTLRYLTRCTEFCLVCHDKMKENFGALKPYVCEKPLCLYQYMNLGFGPSVEHEILTQPWAVDLLVSFCYTSAMNRRLREYPVGMSLSVPPVLSFSTNQMSANRFQPPSKPASKPAGVTPHDTVLRTFRDHEVKYDSSCREAIFETATISPVRVGDWIIITVTGVSQHFRVEETHLFPTIKISAKPVMRNSVAVPENLHSRAPGPNTSSVTVSPPSMVPAKLLIYNQNFDDMDDVGKAETIVMLIETLPSIKEMKAFLINQSNLTQPRLSSWNEQVSPAALGILRWIIASNRSCIVQVDRCPGQTNAELALSKVPLDQRISNISDDWVQFRFAQGSPDKEQRFLNALRAEKANLNPKYPTLFAFHGSALQNWHSIIRCGLDFKETLNGRAFGHGVYHSPDQSTSVGYAQQGQAIWRGSDLFISSAMSLNEIVNCPDKFQSKNPHLVVQHIDWIQCRYLLVQAQGNASYNTSSSSLNVKPNASCLPNPTKEVKQDPSHSARSTLGCVIGVPICATSTSRAFRDTTSEETTSKKRKSTKNGSRNIPDPQPHSDSEDEEDLAFLISDDENQGSVVNATSKFTAKSLTDFIPGSLDKSTLPLLQEPEYATSFATKTLNRALKDVLDVQGKTPAHELGWYIDTELISNMYQWIVELHSFDPGLPLFKDMKAAGISSVVLEVRFGKDFPFSPPFLRVIRPRFLPFTQGGGGHVTAGGAMCMELLTNSGWSSVSSIEGVLLQVRMAISNLDPRPARLEVQGKNQPQKDYSTGEAMAAYVRACKLHGWEVPESFQQFAFNDFA